MPLLTANLGNSRLSLALHDGGSLLRQEAFALTASDLPGAISSFLASESPERAALCSVNPHTEDAVLSTLFSHARTVLRVGRDRPIPMPNRCLSPEKVGLDRLLVSWEAWHLAKGKCLVLDFGTAATLNAVSESGEFLGGAIAPGMGLAVRALAEGTAQLPLAPLTQPSSMIGRSTEEAIAAGVHFGWLGLCEAWIAQARRELGADCPVFATGGDLESLRAARGIDRFSPHLLHEGMRRWLLLPAKR